MHAALTVAEQRSLLKSLAKVQQAALEARSAPVSHRTTRHRTACTPPD